METKPWYQSKTIWANIIVGLSLFFAAPELVPVLPEGSERWLLLVQATLNILMRFISTTAVSVSKPS